MRAAFGVAQTGHSISAASSIAGGDESMTVLPRFARPCAEGGGGGGAGDSGAGAGPCGRAGIVTVPATGEMFGTMPIGGVGGTTRGPSRWPHIWQKTR
jgi:hypothetical protein